MPKILIERNKHNDSGGYQRKNYISCYFLAVKQKDIAEESP